MNKTLKINILNIFLVLIILSFNAYAVTLSDQGTDVKLNNGSTLKLGNLSVKIYDNTTSGSLIFEQNFTNAIINGSWNVMLTNVSLEYGKDYYKDYIINEDDLSFDSNDRIMFTSPLGSISSEDILDDGINDVDINNLSYSKITTCGTNEILKYVNGNWTCSNETDIQWNITTSYYLVNDSGVLIVNETILNQTIDARSANSDTNRSDADILLVASVYNETDLIDSMYNLSLSDASDNLGNWSEDKSDYYNTTQVDLISDTINSSWKSNATDQLDLINAITGDNVSFNQSLTDSLYLGISDQRYNETSLIDSVNNSWKSNVSEQLELINSMDNLSLSDVSDNVGNWSRDKPDYWNTSTNLNLTNNVSILLTGNISSDNFFGNINFSYVENVPGYSLISNLVSYLGNWSVDKLDYYNTTQVDIIATSVNDSWKSNASAQLELINSMDNLSLTDVSNNLGNWSANQSRYMLNDGDTATGNYTFDSNTLHIDSTNDKVGIGTSTPSAKLEINGSDLALNIVNESGDSKFFVNATNGKIGIGTTNPSHELNVIGDVNITQNITLGKKIKFGLGVILQNIANDLLEINSNVNITGNLQVVGNITGGSPVKIKGGLNVMNESGSTSLYVNGTSGEVKINDNSIQNRVSSTCTAGSSIRVINDDGTVECETDTDTTTTTFSTGWGSASIKYLGLSYSATDSCNDVCDDNNGNCLLQLWNNVQGGTKVACSEVNSGRAYSCICVIGGT
jgi:hypothetical protein